MSQNKSEESKLVLLYLHFFYTTMFRLQYIFISLAKIILSNCLRCCIILLFLQRYINFGLCMLHIL